MDNPQDTLDGYNDIHELIELAKEAVDYVPSYFRQKWDMDERLAILQSRLASASRPADAAGAAALIVAFVCFVGLLAWPQQELLFALVGASVLFVSLARQWL